MRYCGGGVILYANVCCMIGVYWLKTADVQIFSVFPFIITENNETFNLLKVLVIQIFQLAHMMTISFNINWSKVDLAHRWCGGVFSPLPFDDVPNQHFTIYADKTLRIVFFNFKRNLQVKILNKSNLSWKWAARLSHLQNKKQQKNNVRRPYKEPVLF